MLSSAVGDVRPMQGLELTALRRLLISSTVFAANARSSAENASMLDGSFAMRPVKLFKPGASSSGRGQLEGSILCEPGGVSGAPSRPSGVRLNILMSLKVMCRHGQQLATPVRPYFAGLSIAELNAGGVLARDMTLVVKLVAMCVLCKPCPRA